MPCRTQRQLWFAVNNITQLRPLVNCVVSVLLSRQKIAWCFFAAHNTLYAHIKSALCKMKYAKLPA